MRPLQVEASDVTKLRDGLVARSPARDQEPEIEVCWKVVGICAKARVTASIPAAGTVAEVSWSEWKYSGASMSHTDGTICSSPLISPTGPPALRKVATPNVSSGRRLPR